MLLQIVSLLVVVLLVALFAWLTWRAWSTRRAVVRWPGTILAGLVTVLLLVVVVVGTLGLVKLRRTHAIALHDATVQASDAQLARGQHLANLCTSCHSINDSLPLNGGDENMASPFGTLYPPNLTPAGPLAGWSDAEVVRAIREGVGKDGRALLIMPSDQFHHMSDDDVRALVAYLRAQPATAHQTPATRFNLLGLLLVGSGLFPSSAQPAITQPVPPAPDGVNPEHGHYLVEISGCQACHGENLTGGTNQFTPKGPNIRAIVPTWTQEQFVRTIRGGADPAGNQLDPDEMPWKSFSAAYSDEELQAIYAYLKSLPAAK
ncbi:MAG TPA: c-type cytochrome [Thermomicrobiaceae bacterium]|nr:c-type cytochrome [Thermomicrobiaceae bacterium]